MLSGMVRLHPFASLVIAAGVALAVVPAFAEAPPPAKVKRQKVDARAMAPGPQASEAPSDAASSPGGLTRDQRKEATLQARQDGTLQPARDAAEPREAGTAPLASADAAGRSPAIDAMTRPVPVADVSPSPSPPATKKKTRKKARGAGDPTPA